MISVIICSADPAQLQKVKENIGNTIGVAHEIIATDNSRGGKGICEVYNEAGNKAIYSILCFMHEDIHIETQNWGSLIASHLEKKETGMIGVAGGDIKTSAPSSWSQPVRSSSINVVQHYRHTAKPAERILLRNEMIGSSEKVAILDGLWLCVRKDVFEKFKFDPSTFPSFHGYDMDYSLQVGQSYELRVIYDIVLHHYSEGSPNQQWVTSALNICKKWKHILPVSIHQLSPAQQQLHYWHCLRVFLQLLFRLKYSHASIMRYYLRFSLTGYFSPRRFLSLGKYVWENMTKKSLK